MKGYVRMGSFYTSENANEYAARLRRNGRVVKIRSAPMRNQGGRREYVVWAKE